MLTKRSVMGISRRFRILSSEIVLVSTKWHICDQSGESETHDPTRKIGKGDKNNNAKGKMCLKKHFIGIIGVDE